MITCKKSVQVGFYQQICGNKYNGKVYQCPECKSKEEQEVQDNTINKDDLEVMKGALEEVTFHSEITDKERTLLNKVKRIL